jgi:hypothetical protein
LSSEDRRVRTFQELLGEPSIVEGGVSSGRETWISDRGH